MKLWSPVRTVPWSRSPPGRARGQRPWTWSPPTWRSHSRCPWSPRTSTCSCPSRAISPRVRTPCWGRLWVGTQSRSWSSCSSCTDWRAACPEGLRWAAHAPAQPWLTGVSVLTWFPRSRHSRRGTRPVRGSFRRLVFMVAETRLVTDATVWDGYVFLFFSFEFWGFLLSTWNWSVYMTHFLFGSDLAVPTNKAGCSLWARRPRLQHSVLTCGILFSFWKLKQTPG